MFNIVIFGAPGSGKGTQSGLINKKYNLTHISTGEMLRREIKNETDLGIIAKKRIDKGQLIPDELICDMLDKVLDNIKYTKGLIFDGFPRTISQAEALDRILKKRGMEVSILLDLQVGDDELIGRLLERGKDSGRSDDNEETIKARLKVYHTQTAPLTEFYKNKGKYEAIKGHGGVEDISNRVQLTIEKLIAEKYG